ASPGFDGVICQPGATTTWARISAQEICHFACFPTGDLLDHLSPRNGGTTGDTGFDAALDAALAQPHRAYGRLATTTSRAELAGLLIGLELAAAKPYWLGERVVVLGDPALMPLYARALTTQGVQAATGNAEAALLAGLYAAFQTVAG
ncbi:MAG: 2-dehydro-3-deoxygalactonokinase, partial [Paracoccus sp. (in: a-proteobacteria)]|nr:2-dehydro-3-deoxygalactonokinase [Paracoccus sp. (in: a-proteobacteria)]